MIKHFLCQLQLHLWGSPSLCADGDWGPERPASADRLDRGWWDLLPGGLNLQHVCHEPCALPTLPRGQKPGAVGSPTAKHLYISRGQDGCSPLLVWLCCWGDWSFIRGVFWLYDTVERCILVFFQSHYSVKKGAAFLGIGMDNVIFVKVDDR